MRTAQSAVLALGLALLLACGGAGGGGGGLSLTAPSSEVVAGFTLQVSASTSDPLVWTIDDPGVARVDQTGGLRGCSPGLVTVAARSPASGESAALAIRVVEDTGFNTQLPVDAAAFVPTVERSATVERCEVTLGHTGIAATVVRAECRRYHRLHLPMAGVLGEEGQPELPYHTLYFAVPTDTSTDALTSWNVEIQRESPLTWAGIRPWPHQPPTWIDGDSVEADAAPDHVVDDEAYTAEEAWPSAAHWAQLVEIGNLPILEVRVAPLRYHPAAGVLELYETTRVIVTFAGTGALAMPRPLGDYKGIQERGPDEILMDYVQNRDVLTPAGTAHLAHPIPPIDTIGVQDLPFDLLIITHPDLEGPAYDLARFRQGLGTRVWLSVLDEAARTDADSVRDAVRTLYDLNRIELTDGHFVHATRALLIFGDVEHIPTFEGMTSRDSPPPTNEGLTTDPVDEAVRIAGTDLFYSTLRGPDTQTDFSLGRISVEDAPEGSTVVDKIEDYEGRPAGQHANETAIYGYFEDTPEPKGTVAGTITFENGERIILGSGTRFRTQLEEGDLIRPNLGVPLDDGEWDARVNTVGNDTTAYLVEPWPHADVTEEDGFQIAREDQVEDKPFLLAAERVREFMDAHGVGVAWGYTRTIRPWGVPLPLRDLEGRGLHTDFAGYGWDVDDTQIADRWKLGYDGIVLQSGHGGARSWNSPFFDRELVPALDGLHGDWLPIVFSINCSTGFFDSETDRAWVWNPSTGTAEIVETTAANGFVQPIRCFCEHVLRKENGGGVAVVGATRGTSSRYNSRLIDAFYSLMYETYAHPVIVPGVVGRPRPLERLGDIVTHAKRLAYIWIASPLGGGRDVAGEICQQTYHLHGDPMLRVRLPRQVADD